MKEIILSFIRIYQRLNSWGLQKFIFGEYFCRFTPTCSEYTYQAIERYGTIKGILLGLARVIRCHPFSKGGEDPLK